MPDHEYYGPADKHMPWNKSKLIGARPPLRPKHVWAIQTRLLHTKIESTVRYLGIEVDDALAIAEQVDV